MACSWTCSLTAKIALTAPEQERGHCSAATFRHDMNDGFPLLTSKRVPFKIGRR
jgi:hypothetical protein